MPIVLQTEFFQGQLLASDMINLPVPTEARVLVSGVVLQQPLGRNRAKSIDHKLQLSIPIGTWLLVSTDIQ